MNKQDINTKFFKKLIERYLEGKTTAEELKLLINYYESFQEENEWCEALGEESVIKDRMLLNVLEAINKEELVKPKVISFYKSSAFKYAMVASVAVLLVSTLFLNNNKGQELDRNTVTLSKNIEVGSDKATLTKEDGATIALEKGVFYTSENVTSDGKELIYKKKNVKNKKITFNYLTIPKGGQFSIKLSDGSQVWLNSDSKLKYPIQFLEGSPREVELIYGEAYFSVTSSEKNKGASFVVIHKNQNINVLGTEFNVKAYQEETNVYTTLVEGKVALAFNDNKSEQLLSPNEQSIYNTVNNSLTVSKVSVFNEISWRKGIFSFNDKSLEEIMRVLSRWYNVEVIFENEEIKNSKFIGVLTKNQDMKEILSIIENFGIIKEYQIKNNKIILK